MSVHYEALLNPEHVYLKTVHNKMVLMKRFVKALDKVGEALHT